TDDAKKVFTDRWMGDSYAIWNPSVGYREGGPMSYVGCFGDVPLGSIFDYLSGVANDPNSYWGCNNSFRGLLGDCAAGAVRGIHNCTDGTSNTFLAGENSPNLNGSLTLTMAWAALASTVIPLNWWTNLRENQVDPATGEICGPRFDVYTTAGYTHCKYSWTY